VLWLLVLRHLGWWEGLFVPWDGFVGAAVCALRVSFRGSVVVVVVVLVERWVDNGLEESVVWLVLYDGSEAVAWLSLGLYDAQRLSLGFRLGCTTLRGCRLAFTTLEAVLYDGSEESVAWPLTMLRKRRRLACLGTTVCRLLCRCEDRCVWCSRCRRRLSLCALREAFGVAVVAERRLGGACHGELVLMILSPSREGQLISS
jgi:hypothetical protein